MPLEARMSRTARLSVALALLLAICAPASNATPRTDFDGLDFSITLKELSAAARGALSLPPGRLFILDGTVTDVSILDKEQASFKVRLELMSGEWIGLTDVKSYSCFVTFSGPDWFRTFPARPPRNPPPGIVASNARVIVVARPLGVMERADGGPEFSLQGLAIRVLP
jgi:hypothetical protein